jgi:hypothetical protein
MMSFFIGGILGWVVMSLILGPSLQQEINRANRRPFPRDEDEEMTWRSASLDDFVDLYEAHHAKKSRQFTAEQKAALDAPLNRSNFKERKRGGPGLSNDIPGD